MDWQPIDTAPKNDIVVLTDGGQLWQGFWQTGRGWMTGTIAGPLSVTLILEPTHWAPLPVSPFTPEEAAARLFAEFGNAPDLLSALRTARDRLALMLRPDDPRNDDAFRLVDDTIKRVEGET